MKKEMLINVLQPEECRIAIVEDGVLEELYVERTSLESYTGNIYKGKIVNLEPAIQAAFVDFSVGRNGFLHVSDIEPRYYSRHLDEGAQMTGRDKGREPRRDDGPPPPRPARGDDAPSPRSSRDEPRPPSRPVAEDRAPRPAAEERPRAPRPPREEYEWPERSEKGRKDRSEAPRPFGEGLIDDWSPPAAPTRASRTVEPPPRATRPSPIMPPRAEVALPTPPPAPEPAAEARTERPPTEDPESLLPPSRTGRRKPAAPSPAADEPADEFRFDAPAPPPAAAPRPPRTRTPRPVAPVVEPEVEAVADEPEPRAAAEPRRARGRGRARPAPEPVAPPEPDFDAEPIDFDEVIEIEPEILDDADEPPRRAGRAAIRSRGGEREPERPRAPMPVEREPERPRPAPQVERPRPQVEREPERPRPAPPAERPRTAPPQAEREFDRPRPPAPERPRSAPTPATAHGFGDDLIEPSRPPEPRARARPVEPPAARDREADPRSKPHDRAGEPGYVPRRARSRGDEAPAPFSWDEPEVDPRRDADPDADMGSEIEDDPEFEAPGAPGEAPRRRRRRRGRRRGPNDRETTAEGAAEGDPDLIDDEGDVAPLPAPRPAPARPPRPAPTPRAEGRPAPAPAPARPADDDVDFDFEDRDDEEDDLDDDQSPQARRGPGDLDEDELDADEEIEPELHEEIRREAEEIAALERELGIRGPVGSREPEDEDRGGPAGRSPRGRAQKPPLQDIFRRGDEVLVQVIKESIGNKGPTLSSYISIPGRYLVLMPGLSRVGVSRKIADEGQRKKLRRIMLDLNPPKGLGFIVRTAGLERTKRELARDLAYLLRLWKVILKRIKSAKSPAPIYQESDMITRTIRDIFNASIDTIWIDEPHAFERAQEFLRVVMPKYVDRLKLYEGKVPLFHKYGLEEEIVKIQRRRVDLPGGGSIVIDPTEALVAIDVNSGNFRVENDPERTAYEMNLKAAKEIARQLRLRDLGGVIVNDFIDMRDERNRRNIEKALFDAVKRDRARTKVLRMSQFGLIEMTRQRIRPSLKRSVYADCHQCAGAGVVKTPESMSIDVMRLMALATDRGDIRRILVTVRPEVAAFLNNRKRAELAQIEAASGLAIHIQPDVDAPAEHLHLECFDAQGAEVRLLPAPAPPAARRGR